LFSIKIFNGSDFLNGEEHSCPVEEKIEEMGRQ